MGKYPDSKIHKLFSDWHIGKGKWKGKGCNSNCYLSDIDVSFNRDGNLNQRLWMWAPRESWPPRGAPIATGDLKWMDKKDKIQPIEKWQADWYESLDVPWYTIWINDDFTEFKIVRHKTGKTFVFTEQEMRTWINKQFPETLIPVIPEEGGFKIE